jgi:hypothetical protein
MASNKNVTNKGIPATAPEQVAAKPSTKKQSVTAAAAAQVTATAPAATANGAKTVVEKEKGGFWEHVGVDVPKTKLDKEAELKRARALELQEQKEKDRLAKEEAEAAEKKQLEEAEKLKKKSKRSKPAVAPASTPAPADEEPEENDAPAAAHAQHTAQDEEEHQAQPSAAADDDDHVEVADEDQDEEQEEEVKPVEKKKRARPPRKLKQPTEVAAPAPPPAKKQRTTKTQEPATNHHTVDAEETHGLTAMQLRHLDQIYALNDTLAKQQQTVAYQVSAMSSVLPMLGMVGQMPLAGQAYFQLTGQELPQQRPRKQVQQIEWRGDEDDDDEASGDGKKRSKKQDGGSRKKVATEEKEDKCAAKNTLTEDTAAFTQEEADEFVAQVTKKAHKLITENADQTDIDKKRDAISSKIRGFFTNNGTTLGRYKDKERWLLLSIAAYIRTVYPVILENTETFKADGTSRGNVFTRIARSQKTTLTDPTHLGALFSDGESHDEFVTEFARVIAYYECFLISSSVEVN